MKEADIVFWMYDVEYGQIRGRVILELMDLMDKEYQEKNWVGKSESSFETEVQFSFELIVEDLLEDYIKNKEKPYDRIGKYLKTEVEAEKIYNLSLVLQNLYLNNDTNEEFLNSPNLPIVRKLSREAFIEFMKNEKDNNKFCEFIVECIKKEERNFTPAPKKSDYENIIGFANQVKV